MDPVPGSELSPPSGPGAGLAAGLGLGHEGLWVQGCTPAPLLTPMRQNERNSGPSYGMMQRKGSGRASARSPWGGLAGCVSQLRGFHPCRCHRLSSPAPGPLVGLGVWPHETLGDSLTKCSSSRTSQ